MQRALASHRTPLPLFVLRVDPVQLPYRGAAFNLGKRRRLCCHMGPKPQQESSQFTGSLTLEGLREYSSHGGDDESAYIFHAHCYFNADDEEQDAVMEQWYKHLQEKYQSDNRVDFGRLHKMAVGPHPLGSFEMIFTLAAFTEVVTYFQFQRPQQLSIMIHPHTFQGYVDHTERPVWIGKQLELKPAMLKGYDEQIAAEVASGKDPIEVLWAHHK